MARFILDVVDDKYKMDIKQVDKICKAMSEELFDGLSFIIICIDDTTDNQFYIDDEEAGYSYTDNKLSKKQIDNYNKWLKSGMDDTSFLDKNKEGE